VNHSEHGFGLGKELMERHISTFSHIVVTPIVGPRTAIDNRPREK
jgi:hypothetical protein